MNRHTAQYMTNRVIAWPIMNGLAFVIVTYIFSSGAAADDSQSLIDSLLSDWTTAVVDCQDIDMSVTIFNYSIMDEQPKVLQGRFLYQKNGTSRWHVDAFGGCVWRSDGILSIDLEHNHYRLFGIQEIAERTKRLTALQQQPRSWANSLKLVYLSLSLSLAPTEPKDVVPFLLQSDPRKLGANYVLSVESMNERRFVTGKAKRPDDVDYPTIAFIFDGRSKLPAAIRVHRSHKTFTTYEFKNVKVDAAIIEDDAFLHPDVSMLKDMSVGEGTKRKDLQAVR